MQSLRLSGKAEGTTCHAHECRSCSPCPRAGPVEPILGDIAGNLARARQARLEAAKTGADIVLFPELFLIGYPPEDLVLKPAVQDACRQALDELARDTADGGPAVLIGLPWKEGDNFLTPLPRSMAGESPACASRSICRITACSMKSASSIPAHARPAAPARRAAWPSDLRGYLDAGGGRMPLRDRRGNPARAEWLALPPWGRG